MAVSYELNLEAEPEPGLALAEPRRSPCPPSAVPLGATVDATLDEPTPRPTLDQKKSSGPARWFGPIRAWGGRHFARRRVQKPWAAFLARLPEVQEIGQLRAILTETAGALLPGFRVAIELREESASPTPLDHPLVLPLEAWEHPVGTIRVERQNGQELSRADRNRLEEFSRLAALLLLGAATARPDAGAAAGRRGTGVDPRDPITGLPRPVSLEAFIEQTCRDRPADRMALILVLPDRLAAFREEVGDPLADAGLTLVGRAVRGSLRSSDRVVRLAGDWIAALLPGIRRADALRVAETVRRAIAEAGLTSSTPWPLTASMGVVTRPEDADDATGLRLAAHRAVARAVAKGGNHVAWLAGSPAPRG